MGGGEKKQGKENRDSMKDKKTNRMTSEEVGIK